MPDAAGEETEGLIGLFVNTLPLRGGFVRGTKLPRTAAADASTALEAYAHQDPPVEKLVEALRVERDLSRPPLFQVLFNLVNTPLPPLELPGLSLRPAPIDSGTG